jgi:hypothetical protein
MVGKNKNRRRTAERLKNFPQLLQLLINVDRYILLHRKGDGNCHVFANRRWAILSPLLLDDSGNLGIS